MDQPKPLPITPGHERNGTGPTCRSVTHRAVASLFIFLVWVYRATLGFWLRGYCRYQPTCSQYMIDAVRRYGPWRGAWRGIKRVRRCHPWGGSGYDPA